MQIKNIDVSLITIFFIIYLITNKLNLRLVIILYQIHHNLSTFYLQCLQVNKTAKKTKSSIRECCKYPKNSNNGDQSPLQKDIISLILRRKRWPLCIRGRDTIALRTDIIQHFEPKVNVKNDEYSRIFSCKSNNVEFKAVKMLIFSVFWQRQMVRHLHKWHRFSVFGFQKIVCNLKLTFFWKQLVLIFFNNYFCNL